MVMIVDCCVLRDVLGVQFKGHGTDCGGCGWKDVGMVATR